MADYPAEVVNTTGTALTERSGTASSDTVPAGAVVCSGTPAPVPTT